MKTPSSTPRSLRLLLALLAAPLARSQAADVPSSPAAPAKDDVVELSPFEVSSSQNTGYQTNETLAGSRLRTNLSDIPSSVNVFTAELMSDLGATGEADLMRYSAAAEPERTDQTPAVQGISLFEGGFTYRIRGQTATRARNYFETNLAPDTFNLETVEEARGPNAILFGLGSAGGIVNTSTKQARLNRNATQLGFTIDNYNQHRGTLDYNVALGTKLAARVNAVYSGGLNWMPDSQAHNKRVAFATTYRPWKALELKVDAEYGKWDVPSSRYFAPEDEVSLWRSSGSPLVPSGVLVATAAQKAQGITNRNAKNVRLTYVGNDASFRNFQGTAVSMPLASLNNSTLFPETWEAFDPNSPYPKKASFVGPAGRAFYEQGAYGLTANLQPVKNLFFELAAVHDENVHHIHDAVPDQAFGGAYNGIFGEPGQTYRDGTVNPYAGDYYVDSRWVNRVMYFYSNRHRLTGAYTFDLGKVFGHHAVAGLLSRDRTDSPRHTDFLAVVGSPFNANPTAAQNLVFTRSYVTNPGNIYQWSSPDYQALTQPFSVVLDPGAAATTYRADWVRNATNDIIQVERAAMVSLQDYFWNDRIVTTAGVRRTLNFEQFAAGSVVTNSFDSKSYGVVFKATPWLSAFYNHSDNATVPGAVQTVIPYNDPLPTNTGEGIDTGLMLRLLRGKVFIRLGYFRTVSLDQTKAAAVGINFITPNTNIVNAMTTAGLSVPDAVSRINGGDFDSSDVRTKGYEMNLTANLTDNWRLMFNATKSESTNQNLYKLVTSMLPVVMPVWQTPAAQNLLTPANVTIAQTVATFNTWYASAIAGDGRATIGHSPLQARLFTRYDIRSSFLRGAFVGGGLSYDSAPVIGYNTTTGATYHGFTQREADVLCGYRVRLPARYHGVRLTFQFNAQNILHQHDFIPLSAQGDGQIVRAIVVAPTRYLFSTKLDF